MPRDAQPINQDDEEDDVGLASLEGIENFETHRMQEFSDRAQNYRQVLDDQGKDALGSRGQEQLD